MRNNRSAHRKFDKQRKLLAVVLVAALITTLLPSLAFADEGEGAGGKIILSDVKFQFQNVDYSVAITEIGAHETYLTVDGTNKTKDLGSSVGNSFKLFYVADAEKVITTPDGDQFWNWGDMHEGYNIFKVATYSDDATYHKWTFTYYDLADKSRYTTFTLRLHKYDKEDLDIFFYKLKIGSDNPTRADFKPVAGKEHFYEYVIAKDVTFPYVCGLYVVENYNYKTLMDGAGMPWETGRPGVFSRNVTFTKAKPYFDFLITPGIDIEETDYYFVHAATWRISVVGKKDASDDTDTSSNKPGDSTADKTGDSKDTSENISGETPVAKPTEGTFTDSNTGKTVAVTVPAVSNKAWTGKQIKPAFTVKANGKALSGSDYAISYGKNKNIGIGKATVKGKGNYSGSITVTFNIIPKKTSITKVTAGKKQLKVTWKAVAKAQKVTKYQIRYRVKGASEWTKKTVPAKSSYTIKKLKPGKAYQVQVRSYKTVAGEKYYSAWSKTKRSKKVK
jgi:hypothetical protein